MFARVARYEVEPDRTHEAIEAFRNAVSQLEQLQGLEGGYVFVDYEDGVVVSMTFWGSRAAMEDSEHKAAGLRHEAAKQVDGAVVSVHSLEAVIKIGSNVGTPA